MDNVGADIFFFLHRVYYNNWIVSLKTNFSKENETLLIWNFFDSSTKSRVQKYYDQSKKFSSLSFPPSLSLPFSLSLSQSLNSNRKSFLYQTKVTLKVFTVQMTTGWVGRSNKTCNMTSQLNTDCRSSRPSDPNAEFYLTNCFVCQEGAKPGQVTPIQFNLCAL